jgi:NADH-quinone oxidoreductase subunit N
LETGLTTKLESITNSLGFVIPEIILGTGILLIVFVGLFIRNKKSLLLPFTTVFLFVLAMLGSVLNWWAYATDIFGATAPLIHFEGMVQSDDFSPFFKILIDLGGVLTVLMSVKSNELDNNRFNTEYYTLMVAAVLGAHLLTMTTNFLMVFISLELLSISSYILAGYSLNKKGAEGSLKYFLFGSVASAIMLYGFSILFGLSGTLDFSASVFVDRLLSNQSPLILIGGLMSLAGFLYKIAAAPMHPWAPDVYEAAPMPVVAFLSVVPKLAGIAILAKFTLAITLFGQSDFDWQIILSAVAFLSIAVGNFSALLQKNPKRMMAYSSIAQTGFLLIGVVCFSIQGFQFLLFYAGTYLLANFAVFICLQVFEKHDVSTIESFSGWGKSQVMVSVVLLIGFVSLAGIPPTAGFSAKLFIFTSLWSAYEQTGKDILVWLLVFGLLNTVVSLFYYLKIPYHAFVKNSTNVPAVKKTGLENYLALFLVLLILLLFIRPDLLMGWLNKINFVL